MTTFLEAQEGISRAWTCPMCGALVIERRRHWYWHHSLAGTLEAGWNKPSDGQTFAELDKWVDADPRSK